MSPSSPWKIRLQSIKGTVRVSKTMTKTHMSMETGMRVLGPPATLASSQVSPPGGLAPSASMCGDVGGRWLPWKCWRAKWVGETRVSLTLESLGLRHPGPLGTGLAVPITAVPRGTGRLVRTDPRDDHGPIHFLWTWTLAYSE